MTIKSYLIFFLIIPNKIKEEFNFAQSVDFFLSKLIDLYENFLAPSQLKIFKSLIKITPC